MKIPDANAAVDKEWDTFETFTGLGTSRKSNPSHKWFNRGRRTVDLFIFESLMYICQRKHSELAKHLHKYRGSCAPGRQRQIWRWIQSSFRGARSISFASGSSRIPLQLFWTFLAWLERPAMQYQAQRRCICQKPPEYHACWRKNAHKCGQDYDPVEARNKWDSIEEPVVPFERNPYRHPVAGLLWERKSEEVLLKHNWEEVPTWEHMWKSLRTQIDLSARTDTFG